jgi:hypothetical protein
MLNASRWLIGRGVEEPHIDAVQIPAIRAIKQSNQQLASPATINS